MISFGKKIESLFTKPNEAMVVTDGQGFIQWVNPAFTELSGFELHELRGKKPGAVLQGELTDQAAVQRIRDAVQSHKPWTEELINYTKGGTPYWVSISISPILDEDLQPRCFVAIEHKITDRAI
jgi:PAS domain S-box-containing protein